MKATMTEPLKRYDPGEGTVKDSKSAFLALPQYGTFHAGCLPGLVQPTARHECRIFQGGGSLLAHGFNALFCSCLNETAKARRGEPSTGPFDVFAMMHADVAAPAGWLDVMLEELDRTDADVLSVVVPIKDERGVTSTGWMADDDSDAIQKITRVTMTQLHNRLPETFDAADLRRCIPALRETEKDPILLVNTGLWVCRLGDWAWEFPGFAVASTILSFPDGTRKAACLSEDWGFSKWAAKQGLKVMATRKVPVTHWGVKGYGNEAAWGTEGFDTRRDR